MIRSGNAALEVSVTAGNLLAELQLVFGILGWILCSSHFPLSPSELLFRDPATPGNFPSWKFSLLGISQAVGSLPRKGSVGSAEAERSWMNKHVLNLALSDAFLILLIQTFLGGLQLHEFQTYFVRLLWKRRNFEGESQSQYWLALFWFSPWPKRPSGFLQGSEMERERLNPAAVDVEKPGRRENNTKTIFRKL